MKRVCLLNINEYDQRLVYLSTLRLSEFTSPLKNNFVRMKWSPLIQKLYRF